MRTITRSLMLGALILGQSASLHSNEDAEFLNFAIFTLPPECFAGIPLEDRPSLFQRLASTREPKGIDYDTGFFYHRKETVADGLPTVLWLKLLPRDTDPPFTNPYSPLAYIHVVTPDDPEAAIDEATYQYMTRVMMWRRTPEKEANWVDVTKKIIPESVDLSLHLPPDRRYPGARIRPKGYRVSTVSTANILAWEDWKLHVRKAYPFSDPLFWEAPVNAERLSFLAFQRREDYSDNRELAELIAHAAIKKDERFRPLLGMKDLRNSPVVSYALAAYEYALDRNDAAIDYIVEKVAEEGNGDTDSKWMLCYFDEWDRTLEVYKENDGRDGAAAEASYMFVQQREYFFPENFEKFWSKKMDELKWKQ